MINLFVKKMWKQNISSDRNIILQTPSLRLSAQFSEVFLRPETDTTPGLVVVAPDEEVHDGTVQAPDRAGISKGATRCYHQLISQIGRLKIKDHSVYIIYILYNYIYYIYCDLELM